MGVSKLELVATFNYDDERYAMLQARPAEADIEGLRTWSTAWPNVKERLAWQSNCLVGYVKGFVEVFAVMAMHIQLTPG